MIHFLHRKLVDPKPAIIAAVGLLALGGIIFYFHHKSSKPDNAVTIVLSPHFDDAVLSMGGLLAKHEHPTVVATFVTALPPTATTTPWDSNSGFKDSTAAIPARTNENVQAMKALGVDEVKNYGYTDFQYRNSTSTDAETEQEMSQDIQALIASCGTKEISIYAPSTFGPGITHPDHLLLHRAFADVAESYPNKNVTFYFYEDYPYIEQFNQSSVISIEKNLENDTGRIFDTVQIPLSSRDVNNKEKALEKYTSQVKAFDAIKKDIVKDDIAYTQKRCGTSACEVVYKLFRVSE